MYNRLLRFLSVSKILSDNQYCFCKHHSTAYALACLYDKISSAIENKEYTVGILIDLSKVFDTVDHHILISKLILKNALEKKKQTLAFYERFCARYES